MGQQGSGVKLQGGRRGRGIQVFKAVLHHKEKEHSGQAYCTLGSVGRLNNLSLFLHTQRRKGETCLFKPNGKLEGVLAKYKISI